MPIYEYKCEKCHEQFEVLQKFSDEPLASCEVCGGELKKLMSNTSFVLKGTGWYATDYPSADRQKATGAKKCPASGKDEKCDNKPCAAKKAAGAS